MKKLILTMFLLFPFVLFAAERGVWVEAEGSSVMGSADTFQEVSRRAENDALRNAAEEAAGIFISSHTLVSNSQLTEDLVYAAVQGKVVQSEVISSGWDNEQKNLYLVRVKALIEPVYGDSSDGLRVEATLSKYDLKENEAVDIYYKTNSDAYVYIFSVGADGSVTLLFPNAMMKDNSIKGGEARMFPPLGSEIVLTACFLPGFKGVSASEYIKVIATRNDEQLLALGFREGLFEVYDAKGTGMISDLTRKLNKLNRSDWSETTVRYDIKR